MSPLDLRHTDLRALRADLGFSQEALARALDVSARTVERWEGGAGPGAPEMLRRVDQLAELATLGREVYGVGLARFMTTPRRSLGHRTPAASVIRGDIEEVMGILTQAYEGQWG
ncbi:MAG: helix-turn-helix transcriptional regulator [Chloroflexota bacterium]|nr:helix-turn-helix transcriptional regulator [Chloroflexota bacterium]MDQ3690065.1 helix-turn-helix transcriptional regulator [Chloroflexota bacterium]